MNIYDYFKNKSALESDRRYRDIFDEIGRRLIVYETTARYAIYLPHAVKCSGTV
jgi:hypothetical protein